MKYNKDKIKENLSIQQVYDFVNFLGGNPRMDKSEKFFVSETICHNHKGEGSHKLYYYDNTKLFRCFTECEPSTFDIFELVRKVKIIEENIELSLFEAIVFVVKFFNIQIENAEKFEDNEMLQDWKTLNKYSKIINEIQDIPNNPPSLLITKFYDEKILAHLPQPRIIPWEEDGIPYETIERYGIKYDPSNQCIVIPHYDINGKLIGIRGRTLIKEEEEFGKYKPLFLNQTLYNHPLGLSLYNLNNSKNNIKEGKRAIIFESEKSCMRYYTEFGADADISCAVCGSSFTNAQAELLMSLDVKYIDIAFDKQFEDINSNEGKRWCNKLREINKKFSPFVQVEFIFDKWNLLGYKESPIDRDKNTFLELFNRRIIL